jgi:hypothetical protein
MVEEYKKTDDTFTSYDAARHRREVQNAIALGKSVPPEVLKDYPDLVTPAAVPGVETVLPPSTKAGVAPPVKEPWQMSIAKLPESLAGDVQKWMEELPGEARKFVKEIKYVDNPSKLRLGEGSASYHHETGTVTLSSIGKSRSTLFHEVGHSVVEGTVESGNFRTFQDFIQKFASEEQPQIEVKQLFDAASAKYPKWTKSEISEYLYTANKEYRDWSEAFANSFIFHPEVLKDYPDLVGKTPVAKVTESVTTPTVPVKGTQIPVGGTGESIAREVGARYDGIQEGTDTIPDKMQFTDTVTGSTTYGNTLEEVKTNITRMREAFAAVKAEPTVEAQTIEGAMTQSARESTFELRQQVSDVRYGKLGEILFEFQGKTYKAKEPTDVMPVGQGEASQSWALKQILNKKTTLVEGEPLKKPKRERPIILGPATRTEAKVIVPEPLIAETVLLIPETPIVPEVTVPVSIPQTELVAAPKSTTADETLGTGPIEPEPATPIIEELQEIKPTPVEPVVVSQPEVVQPTVVEPVEEQKRTVEIVPTPVSEPKVEPVEPTVIQPAVEPTEAPKELVPPIEPKVAEPLIPVAQPLQVESQQPIVEIPTVMEGGQEMPYRDDARILEQRKRELQRKAEKQSKQSKPTTAQQREMKIRAEQDVRKKDEIARMRTIMERSRKQELTERQTSAIAESVQSRAKELGAKADLEEAKKLEKSLRGRNIAAEKVKTQIAKAAPTVAGVTKVTKVVSKEGRKVIKETGKGLGLLVEAAGGVVFGRPGVSGGKPISTKPLGFMRSAGEELVGRDKKLFRLSGHAPSHGVKGAADYDALEGTFGPQGIFSHDQAMKVILNIHGGAKEGGSNLYMVSGRVAMLEREGYLIPVGQAEVPKSMIGGQGQVVGFMDNVL